MVAEMGHTENTFNVSLMWVEFLQVQLSLINVFTELDLVLLIVSSHI